MLFVSLRYLMTSYNTDYRGQLLNNSVQAKYKHEIHYKTICET